jgi:hypothetical protein
MGRLEAHDGSTLVTEMQKPVFMKFVEQIHSAHIANRRNDIFPIYSCNMELRNTVISIGPDR